jgi:UDP-2,3-diacylglucosamine pyrophosphatase LpxH
LKPLQSNLLVLSDIHLGRDVLEGFGAGLVQGVSHVDRDLAAFLEHYGSHPQGGHPWKLIVAGDMIEFIGMAVRADGPLQTPVTEEEALYGLGSAPDHVLVKLARVFDRHPLVMNALASFVNAGHEVVILRGNHDVELFWDEVQTELRERLVTLAGVAGEAADRFRGRISFSPWFHFEPGLVWIEHGHQYDPMCSFDFQLYPVHPRNHRRIVDDLSALALRFIVNPTPKLNRDAAEHWSIGDFVRLVRALGLREIARMFLRYMTMTRRLIELWRGSRAAGLVRRLAEEHERRMKALPFARELGTATLRAIDALRSAPVGKSLLRTLQSAFLDRFVLGTLVLLATLAALVLGSSFTAVATLVASSAAAAGLATLSARQRVVDATPSLRVAAGRLAERVDARFVVMGHTHRPMAVPLGGARWYYNVGNWTEEDGPPSASAASPRAPLTHLVIDAGSDPRAELRCWHRESALPRLFSGDASESPTAG